MNETSHEPLSENVRSKRRTYSFMITACALSNDVTSSFEEILRKSSLKAKAFEYEYIFFEKYVNEINT